jgi:tetratricopeptide (TPR) repeat protein
MAEDTMFSEAVAAVRAGEVVRARDLLARLLRADSANPDYWIWMSSIVETERESVYCLRSATKLRPNHPLARLGLGVMGQISLVGERESPVRQQRSAPMPHQSAGRINSMGDWWKVRRNRENMIISTLGVAAVAVVIVIALLQARISSWQFPFFSGGNTAIAGEATLRAGTEAAVGGRSTLALRHTVNPSTLVPFETYVGVDFTPTPLYGLTPMPQTAAFDQAIEAYRAGRYDEALADLQQVLFVEPDSAQVYYFMGEIYRQQYKMAEALDAYNKSIELDPNFAPAYYGLAMRSKDMSAENDYDKDLSRAIDRDPNFVPAYIERAGYYIFHKDWESARSDLDLTLQLEPDNALALIRIGRVEVRLDEADDALDKIIRGQIIDPTILEGYLALGEAYDALNLYSQAVTPLVVYTTYAPEDITGWLRLGEAYNGTGKYPDAVTACSRAIDLNPNIVEPRLCRGQAYRLIGNHAGAVDDLKEAAKMAPNLYQTEFLYGCALLENGQPIEAVKVLAKAIELATTVDEKADAMGWQALAYEAYNSNERAKNIWWQLMNMEGVSEYWQTTAYRHYYGLTSSPTPGSTATSTPNASETPAPSPTATSTPTP